MKLKLLIGCLAVAVLAGCSSMGKNEAASKSPRAADIRAALDASVIPLVDFENVRVDQALLRWSQLSMSHHPLHKKFPFQASYPPPARKTINLAGPVTSSSQPVPMDYLPTVTVRRRDVSSKRVLDEICDQAGLVWMIQGRVIMIKPAPADRH